MVVQDLVPVTEVVDIPYEFHREIIGQKGHSIRKLMEQFDVHISVPAPDERSEAVRVNGTPSCVARAIEGLKARVEELEGDKQERVGLHIGWGMLTCARLFRVMSRRCSL